MAFLHEEDNHNHKDEKKEHDAEDRYSLEPQKAHPTPTGEFVIIRSVLGTKLAIIVQSALHPSLVNLWNL